MIKRPILFSAPMVRALLEGSKTQTRRPMKVPPSREDGGVPFGDAPAWAHAEPGSMMMRCPYGKRSDGLYVRESFSGAHGLTGIPPRHWHPNEPIWYWADGEPTHGDWTKPKPGMHMPRWASRITLEVTGVRVERLNDISRGDAMEEGCPLPNMQKGPDPRQWYAELWNTINGPGAWDANSWVWCVSFKVL